MVYLIVTIVSFVIFLTFIIMAFCLRKKLDENRRLNFKFLISYSFAFLLLAISFMPKTVEYINDEIWYYNTYGKYDHPKTIELPNWQTKEDIKLTELSEKLAEHSLIGREIRFQFSNNDIENIQFRTVYYDRIYEACYTKEKFVMKRLNQKFSKLPTIRFDNEISAVDISKYYYNFWNIKVDKDNYRNLNVSPFHLEDSYYSSLLAKTDANLNDMLAGKDELVLLFKMEQYNVLSLSKTFNYYLSNNEKVKIVVKERILYSPFRIKTDPMLLVKSNVEDEYYYLYNDDDHILSYFDIVED